MGRRGAEPLHVHLSSHAARYSTSIVTTANPYGSPRPPHSCQVSRAVQENGAGPRLSSIDLRYQLPCGRCSASSKQGAAYRPFEDVGVVNGGKADLLVGAVPREFLRQLLVLLPHAVRRHPRQVVGRPLRLRCLQAACGPRSPLIYAKSSAGDFSFQCFVQTVLENSTISRFPVLRV